MLDNIVLVGVGIVAAVWAFTTNVSDPAWGADAPKQWFTLLGITFSAYTTAVSGAAALRVAGRSVGPKAEDHSQDETPAVGAGGVPPAPPRHGGT